MTNQPAEYVQDESSNNPHFGVQDADGQWHALCNRRYRVYTISSDYGQRVMDMYPCPRCLAKAAKAAK